MGTLRIAADIDASWGDCCKAVMMQEVRWGLCACGRRMAKRTLIEIRIFLDTLQELRCRCGMGLFYIAMIYHLSKEIPTEGEHIERQHT